MCLVLHYLDAFSSLFLVMLSQLGQIVVYDWDGEQPQHERVAFVDMCGGSQEVAADGNVGPFGWVDLRKTGNPHCDIMMTTYESSGVRDIAVSVDYGEMVAGVIHVVNTQRERSTQAVEYGPFVGIYRMSFDRGYGTYARIREIHNDGDMMCAVQARGSGTFKIMPVTATADRDVEVV